MTAKFIEVMISWILTTLPYRLLSYYPFMDKLRLPKKAVLGLILSTQLLIAYFIAFFYCKGFSIRPVELCFSLCCFIIYFSCIRVHPFMLAFFYAFMAAYLAIVRGITYFLLGRFLIPYLTWTGGLLHLFIWALTLAPMCFLLKQAVSRMFQIKASQIWSRFWLLPSFTTLMVLFFTWDLEFQKTSSLRFLLARVLLLVCMLLIYKLLLSSLDTLRRQAVLEEQARSLERFIQVQRNQFEQLQKHMGVDIKYQYNSFTFP